MTQGLLVGKLLVGGLGVGPKVTSWLTSPDGLAAKTLDDLLYACNEDGIDNLIDAAKTTNKLLAVM